ncbi:hypothetical protein PG984_010374 [Apiospora sp. TS-2023a]
MKPLSLDSLSRPSEEESRYYYVGLSGGKLIVRTNASKRPWRGVRTQPGWAGRTHPVGRKYLALGVHPTEDLPIIFGLRPLLPQIAEMLNAADAPWTWFTGIRIGYGYDPKADLLRLPIRYRYFALLLLNVEFGTTFERVAGVVKDIQGLLDHHHVPIHVEVRENTVYTHGASTGLPEHRDVPTLESIVQDSKYWTNALAADDVYDARLASEETLHLLSTLGWEMAITNSEEAQGNSGTAGPFFGLEGSDGLFASTCLHPFLADTGNQTTAGKEPGSPGLEVSQARPEMVAWALGQVEVRLEKYGTSPTIMGMIEKVRRHDEWLNSRSGPQPQEPSQRERTEEEVYKYLTAIRTALDTVSDDKVPGKDGDVIPGTGLKKRLVGNVYVTPGTNSRGLMDDWALVRLDKEKFKKPSNKVSDFSCLFLLYDDVVYFSG